jgi:glucose-1-phosphatase
MFMMKGVLALFISLALGYSLCVLANKQKGVLRTVGYTLGTAMIVLSLVYSAVESCAPMCVKNGSWHDKAMKCHPGMFMKGRIK